MAKEADPDREVVLIERRNHRLGRLRAQRRILRGLAGPRRIQRRNAPAQGKRPAAPSSAPKTSPDIAETDPQVRHRLRLLGNRRAERGHREAPGRSGSRRRPRPTPGCPFLDADEVKTHINSPIFEGGIWDKESAVLVHPAKLAWGLRRVCLDLGVKIFEHTKGTELDRHRRRPSPSAPAPAPSPPSAWHWPPTCSRRCSSATACTPSRCTTTR